MSSNCVLRCQVIRQIYLLATGFHIFELEVDIRSAGDRCLLAAHFNVLHNFVTLIIKTGNRKMPAIAAESFGGFTEDNDVGIIRTRSVCLYDANSERTSCRELLGTTSTSHRGRSADWAFQNLIMKIHKEVNLRM